MKLEFSPAAREDLIDIAVHIAQDHATRAPSFVDELEARCAMLAAAPGIGRARPELGAGLRMLPQARYLIFYRQAPKSLRIERILHSARDVGDDDFQQ